jgi:hypothetical protein
VRLNVSTDRLRRAHQELGTSCGPFRRVRGRFATTLLGVTRLFTPELLVLLEAAAAD